MNANVRRYAQLPLQSTFLSVYPKDSQMNQHEQPLGPAIAYDRLLGVCALFILYYQNAVQMP
jgi:hypothetical protein